MEDEIITKLLDKFASEKDPTNLLMIGFGLTIAILSWAIREKWLVKWKSRPRPIRWLTDTYLGGVATAMFVSGLGAVATTIAAAIVASGITWFAVVKIFMTGAIASGFASWKKAQRKDHEMKVAVDATKEEAAPPVPPPLPPAALLLFGLLGLGACASPITTAARLVQSAAEFGGVARDTLQDIYDQKLTEATKRAAATGDTAKARADADILDGKMKIAKGALRSYSAALVVAKGSIVVAQSGRDIDLGVVIRELLAAYDALSKALAAFDIKLPKLSEVGPPLIRMGVHNARVARIALPMIGGL